MDEGWDQIVARAWSPLLGNDLPFIVRPSIPVLYFGDRPAYERSPLRVVTVGLNPSLKEFPRDRPFGRFPGAANLRPDDASGLLRTLDDYFRANPYRGWFQSYEPVLNGLEASYYDGQPSTALHTDLFSPLATNPTWSGLDAAQRSLLENSGVGLWHDLVSFLRPQVVILSIARMHLHGLAFRFDGPWREIARLTRGKHSPRSRPYVVECRRSVSPFPAIFIFGEAAQTPFGTVDASRRREIGNQILKTIRAG